jgi:DNA-binding CsgD family transcriptional regulator
VVLSLDPAQNRVMRLIERESQLAALHQYAKEASEGQGRLVLISGEAGVGKSVLLEESAGGLDEARWLEGRLDAAISELDRVRSFSAGATAVERCWMALWRRRLTGIADAVDVEPFASQLAGDGARAAMLWDRLDCPYQAALALLDTKEEIHLRESLTRLVDLGADATARLVRRTMRDLGIRSVPAGARTVAKAHPRGLTAREQEILQLVSQDQSNEEISASLFISVRTVEHHVSAILAKLGTDSRKGAANEARRLGLTRLDGLSVANTSR